METIENNPISAPYASRLNSSDDGLRFRQITNKYTKLICWRKHFNEINFKFIESGCGENPKEK